jgi:hypothetical protein
MARVTSINFGRTYNDGDYESTRIDITVDLDPGEDTQCVFEKMCEHMDDLRRVQKRRQRRQKTEKGD